MLRMNSLREWTEANTIWSWSFSAQGSARVREEDKQDDTGL